MGIREEFEKAFLSEFKRGGKATDWATCFPEALWAAQFMAMKCASIANHYMADQTDPAKSVAASDIKIMIRQLSKELSQ